MYCSSFQRIGHVATDVRCQSQSFGHAELHASARTIAHESCLTRWAFWFCRYLISAQIIQAIMITPILMTPTLSQWLCVVFLRQNFYTGWSVLSNYPTQPRMTTGDPPAFPWSARITDLATMSIFIHFNFIGDWKTIHWSIFFFFISDS